MKKFTLFFVYIMLTLYAFSDGLAVAKQFVDNKEFLSDYNILELNLKRNDESTYLFYKPYNNRILKNSDEVMAFTDAVIIKVNNEKVLHYLVAYKNGLVKTNDDVIFYDFSEKGYSHLKFNGWLLGFRIMKFDDSNINTINLQLTNNGIKEIPADPRLPSILWDYDYPVRYKYYMSPFDRMVDLIEYEWHENLKIIIARSGLRDHGVCSYLDKLSAYDKRIIVNAMFAIHGYQFKTQEWITYFEKFKWYKPDSSVKNDVNILDKYQQELFEYLTK